VSDSLLNVWTNREASLNQVENTVDDSTSTPHQTAPPEMATFSSFGRHFGVLENEEKEI
jgi:hypothetical protein